MPGPLALVESLQGQFVIASVVFSQWLLPETLLPAVGVNVTSQETDWLTLTEKVLLVLLMVPIEALVRVLL